jgi:hypothetical protein
LVKRSVSIARFEPGAAKGGVCFRFPHRGGTDDIRVSVQDLPSLGVGAGGTVLQLSEEDCVWLIPDPAATTKTTQPRQARDNQTMGKQLTQRKKKEAVRLSRTVSLQV